MQVKDVNMKFILSMRQLNAMIFCTLINLGALPNLIAKATAQADLQFKVLDTKAHDKTVFTQGLELHGNIMLESSGLYGRSFIRKYHTHTKRHKCCGSLTKLLQGTLHTDTVSVANISCQVYFALA